MQFLRGSRNFLKYSKATMTKGSLDRQQADVPRLGGGPLGLGDPDDLRLRKTEKDVLIPKMMREEASQRCKKEVEAFYECSKKAGLSVLFKCRDENQTTLDCMKSWMDNPEFVEEITNKYLYARSYYRRTGKPLKVYERSKGPRNFC